YYLVHSKGVDGRGMELSQSGVNSCVRHGLSVIQGDADNDLEDYPSDAFDYVVLSQTLQATRRPRDVLLNLVRIGRHAIVSFPNFGHWRIRMGLLIAGRLPSTALLPYPWYDTPNIHLCTVNDFDAFLGARGHRVLDRVILAKGRPARLAPNLTGELAIYRFRKP
ncbi:MAG TPA: methionine biosynthesis protein MetW, partial [Casimicrobiaceae bacterium]|nr:methionine biosynthesis protein MetW [Casimicrobiaceae bacterium]